MHYRLITTVEAGITYCALIDEKDKLIEIDIEDSTRQSIIGNIYIGKVSNIVKELNIAFVNIGLERDVFLQLEPNSRYHFTNGKEPHDKIKVGDELLVQVTKEAYMKKPPSVTTNISFTGKYCVLTYGKSFIGLSSKIRNDQERLRLRTAFKPYINDEYGFIVRTNAVNIEQEVLELEIKELISRYEEVTKKASFDKCFSCLHKQPPLYIKMIRDLYYRDVAEYIFDDEGLYNEAMSSFEGEIREQFRYIESNNYNLFKLFSIEKKIGDAINKRVFLRSGATLIIEHTEALTVIDVNSSKASSKKKKEKALYDINFEAANEIARQLRLRNISGIIVVDFIDMKDPTNNQHLLNHLRQICDRDKTKTTVVDITALGLVEITRKKSGVKLQDKVNLIKNNQFS